MTDQVTPNASNHDNISSHLLRAYIKESISPKTNNPYYQLIQEWNRPGNKVYTFKAFLNDEQKALLEDTVPVVPYSQVQ